MQTLKLNFQLGDVPSLHPHDLLMHTRGISLSKTLYEGLTRIDAKGHAKLSGAKSVEVSPDRLRYTFTLRDNAWSDGSPVTAFQYENAWKEALSPASTCSLSELLYMIKNAKEARLGSVPLDAVGIKAKDAKTLIVDLAHPSPFFLELAAQPICAPLLHPKQKEMTEFNGPFMIAKWEKNSLLQLKPNPYFWDKKQVVLQQIDIFMIQDTNTAYSFFKEGKIDYIGVPLCTLSAEQIEHMKMEKVLRSHSSERVFWVYLNTQHLGLSSTPIRQALAMSIRRQPILDHILIGGNPLLTPLPSTLLPMPGPSLKEDLGEAKKRFEQGLKELGMTRETFPPLVITYSQQANRKQVAEYLQQNWSALGIKVQLVAKDFNTLRVDLAKGLFEIAAVYQAPYYKDPLELLEYFTSLSMANVSQWVHPFFVEKISAARQEKEFHKRTQILGEAEQFLLEQMPFIPICTDTLMFAHAPNLQGYVFDCLGAIDFSYASFTQ